MVTKNILTLATIGIFLLMFFVGNVNAFEFDNIKSYNPVNKEITIINIFGLGNEIAKYKLIENTDQCLINCYAEGYAYLYSKGYLFSKVDFKNSKGISTNLESSKILIKKTSEKINIIYDYEKICELVINKTTLKKENQCTQIIIGNHTEIRAIKKWEEYNGEILDEGDYHWRIDGIKNREESIDWIASSFGEDFKEWAWWNSDWNKKKEIKVKDNAGSTINNYTIDLTIPYDANMNADYSDLRFTNGAENSELGYWIYFANSTEARVKVRIEDNLVANNNVSIYMYYDNSVSTTSDIANAHIVGEDGNDFSEWTENDAGGELNLDTTDKRVEWANLGRGETAQLYRPINNLHNYTVEFVFNIATSNNWVGLGAIGSSTDSFYPSSNAIQWMGYHNANVITTREKYTEANSYGTGANLQAVGGGDYSATDGTDYFVRMTRNGSTMDWEMYSNSIYTNLVGSSTSQFDSSTLLMTYAFLFNNIDDTTGGDGTAGWLTNYSISKYVYPIPLYFIGSEEESNDLDITLNSPVNYLNSTLSTIDFNCSATDGIGVENLTLIINGVDNSTDTGGAGQNLTLTSSLGMNDGFYNWTCRASDGTGTSGDPTTATIRYLTIDTIAPIVNQANNLTNLTTFSLPVSSNWNYTASDTHLSQCYYNTTDNATLTFVTCNTPTITTNWATQGDKIIYYCANDTLGFETCKFNEISIFFISIDQTESIDPSREGELVNYTLQVNMTNIPTTTAYFIFNGVNYLPTSTASTNSVLFSYGLTMQNGWGNSTGNITDWNWIYSIDGITTNTSTNTENTTVYSVVIDDCSIYEYVILNLSLKDEEGNSYINISADATNIEVDLTLTKGSSTWTYSNQWLNQNNVTVCIPDGLLNNTNYTIDFTIGFDTDNHVNEFFYLDNGTLSDGGTTAFNSLTSRSIDLMDLLTADSTSFLFNYFDEDGLVVDDIIVHVFRKYIGEGVFREIERAKQNDDGDTVIHLVEEDVIYYFIISKEGEILFTSNTYTALCQTTPCEIQLEESGGFQEFETGNWDLIKNGGYSISSSSLTRIVNLTYSLTSPSIMNLTIYKLDSDGSYLNIGSDQATGTSGSLFVTVPIVSGNTSFFASVYQDEVFKKSQWIDFEEDAGLYFGNTLSLFLGALIIMSLGLMAVTEGSAVIIFLMLGMFVAMALGLVDYRTSTGLNILIYFISAGGIILWKITRRNR